MKKVILASREVAPVRMLPGMKQAKMLGHG
jgi:hypothetical protein